MRQRRGCRRRCHDGIRSGDCRGRQRIGGPRSPPEHRRGDGRRQANHREDDDPGVGHALSRLSAGLAPNRQAVTEGPRWAVEISHTPPAITIFPSRSAPAPAATAAVLPRPLPLVVWGLIRISSTSTSHCRAAGMVGGRSPARCWRTGPGSASCITREHSRQPSHGVMAGLWRPRTIGVVWPDADPCPIRSGSHA